MTWAELLIAKGRSSGLLLACTHTHAAYRSSPLSPTWSSTGWSCDLWADRMGLGPHFKPVDEGQSALWVHVSLSCLAFPDKAGRIRGSEPPPPSLPLSHIHLLSFISRFSAPCLSPTLKPWTCCFVRRSLSQCRFFPLFLF